MATTIKRISLQHVDNTDFRDRGERHRMAIRRSAKVFVFPEGETLLENLANRRSRPADMYRAAVQERVKSELIAAGKLPEDAPFTMHWSQKAGCTCGCSPGFIIKGTTTGVDVYINLEETP